MSLVGRRFPTLSRHWAVFREAWRQQKAADGERQRRIEHEFLPAALEIVEKPPSPGLRWLTLTLCGLFGVALIWAVFGRVDVVAVATGRTIPVANIKVVQSPEIAVVRAIHVRNGQRVRRGDLLIELDPTTADADESQAAQGLLSARITEARNQALLAHLQGRPAVFRPPAGTPAEIVGTQNRLIQSKVAEYEAQRSALVQTRAQHAAELAAASAEVAKLRGTLPLVDEQLQARRRLTAQGNFSRLRLLEYEQARIEHGHNIEVQESAVTRSRAAMAGIDAQLAQLRQAFAKDASTELATAETDSSLRAEELRKSARRRELQQLRAPVDGTVQQLAVHTVGGVIQPAQPVLVVVPNEGGVEVEAQVLNRDIGFVAEGQEVRVKFEAFPFTDYGWIDGVVETISRDAVQDEHLGLVYSARVRLSADTIAVNGRAQPIGPGMAVQAEIKTGERRIIQYLLSPLSQTVSEAGRER